MKINNIFPSSISNISFSKAKNNIPKFESEDKIELGIDISSRSEFPINILSNFTETNFVLDGVNIKSMEGFLQSLKTPDLEMQKKICSEYGTKAKGYGKKLNKKRNYDFKHLYWNGKRYNRQSKEYIELLNKAYSARYEADSDFRFALEYTKGRALKHSIGGKDNTRTLLTEQEFVGILTQLRDNN